ncbi:acetyltransferase [Thecamonas trahens ATCC 50062]|uniref:Acetyltransferase n=1 Tax=Thecamonas trahens ATCC 50062 TaxID=461836 RepID=A0A0L0DE61_THETB|nr:acetyltransferase [Thecamonas trahens ATCC 50062]KNC50456.1 acetyltransferase [Thecamonas trahens ATCC 50062]|eukprot:XP_013762352.1 acetyltransferase [Thecamonas trahens ATCC 50062]
MAFQVAVTESVSVGLVSHRHVPALFAAVDSTRTRHHLRAWLPWVDTIRDEDSVKAVVSASLAQFVGDRGAMYGVWLGADLVGSVSWSVSAPAHPQTAELGGWLVPDAVGKGIMSQSMAYVVRYLFDSLDFVRLELRIATHNTRGLALADALGFVREGTLREAALVNGQAHDVAMFSLLRAEWRAATLAKEAKVEEAKAAADEARAKKRAALTSGPSIFDGSVPLPAPVAGAKKKKAASAPASAAAATPTIFDDGARPRSAKAPAKSPSIFGETTTASAPAKTQVKAPAKSPSIFGETTTASAPAKAPAKAPSIFGETTTAPAPTASPAPVPVKTSNTLLVASSSDGESEDDEPAAPAPAPAPVRAPASNVASLFATDDGDDDDLFGGALPVAKKPAATKTTSLFGDDDDGDSDFWF